MRSLTNLKRRELWVQSAGSTDDQFRLASGDRRQWWVESDTCKRKSGSDVMQSKLLKGIRTSICLRRTARFTNLAQGGCTKSALRGRTLFLKTPSLRFSRMNNFGGPGCSCGPAPSPEFRSFAPGENTEDSQQQGALSCAKQAAPNAS